MSRHFWATASSACAGICADMEEPGRNARGDVGIVWFQTRASNDRSLTGSLHSRHISESLDIIILLEGGSRPGREGFRLIIGGGAACSTPKTDPPGRGNPGGSR